MLIVKIYTYNWNGGKNIVTKGKTTVTKAYGLPFNSAYADFWYYSDTAWLLSKDPDLLA